MQQNRPRSRARQQQRESRARRLEQAWKEHYDALVSGKLTLAEVLQHSDEKLMEVADKGLRMLKLGKYELARKIFGGLVLLDPFVPYFHLLLGTLHQKLGELDEAVGEFEQTVELCDLIQPPAGLLPMALLAQAKVLGPQGRAEEALPLVERLLAPDFPARVPKVLGEAQLLRTHLQTLVASG